MILVGDIGGTKTHLALFSIVGKKLKMERDQKFPSKDFPALLPIIREFLAPSPEAIESACFGVAGPVKNGRCQVTNLPWVIDAHELSKELNIASVSLLDDLEAMAHGMSSLDEQEIAVLNVGDRAAVGNQALIAAGTGLGEAGLYWDGKTHHPFACEGGHVDFAPRDELEMELLRYLKEIYTHVSYERVLSGPGLHHLYDFLIDMHLEEQPQWLKEKLLEEDPAKVISELGMQKEDPACETALNWFVSLYGAAAGNLALKMLSTGGLFVGGGIAPKILSALQEGKFMESFLAKGRFQSFLEAVPVRVLLNQNTALIGAANYADKNRLATN